MPYKRGRSKYYYVNIRTPSGQRIRRSTGTTDKKEAEALEAKWKLNLFQEQHWDKVPDITYEDVMLHYLKNRPKNQSERASDEDWHREKTLSKSFAGKVMNQLTGSDIHTHKTRRIETVSAATINRELAQLSSAINRYNLDYETNLPNPVKGRKIRLPESRIRWITRAESEKLINAAAINRDKAPYLQDLITLALHTGMRKNEMLELDWSRVDLENNLIHLEGRHTKTKRRRSIPINRTAKTALLSRLRFNNEHYPDALWVFVSRSGSKLQSIRKSFVTACQNAGITDFRFHDLRHTCASWLESNGVPLLEVQTLLGHTSITMTEKYAHLAPENVRTAVDLLDNAPAKALKIVKN